MRRDPTLDVRRAHTRSRTSAAGLDTRHAFSFGRHYDPGNTGHGVLVAHNDERVAAGRGFDDHPHQDLEIVTWVVEGALLHEDAAGHRAVVRPGTVQVLSAGRGVVHSERQDADGDPGSPVRFVQSWVLPDGSGGPPVHAVLHVADVLAAGELVPVASGRPEHRDALPLRRRGAALHVARLAPGQQVRLPDAPLLHLSLPVGEVDVEGAGPLAEGDALRAAATGGQRVTATSAAEVLVWELPG